MKSLDSARQRKSAGRPVKLRKILPPKVPREPSARVPSPPGQTWKKTFWGTAGLAILLVVIISILILPEARIQVEPRTEPITRDLEIRVDQKQDQPNLAELIIPGKLLEQEVAGNKTFASTGSKNVGRTASGFVLIYNFSKTTLILKAKTTVLSSGGLKYYFTQDVGNIRPTALIGLEEQEVDASSLIPPVPVVAAGPGPEYNLPKGTRLEIENEVFGLKPKVLYATSAEDISGGSSREIKVVTEGDVASAYSQLAKDLVEQTRGQITSQNSSLKLLDNAVATEVQEQRTAVAAGTEAAEFEVVVRLKLRALLYDEAEVRSLIRQRLERLLPENKILQAEAKSRLQSKFVSVSLEQGQGVLSNHFEGQISYRLQEAELLLKVKGKRQEEIREVLLSRPEISSVEVKFYPFWVERAPKFGRKIYLQILEPKT